MRQRLRIPPPPLCTSNQWPAQTPSHPKIHAHDVCLPKEGGGGEKARTARKGTLRPSAFEKSLAWRLGRWRIPYGS